MDRGVGVPAAHPCCNASRGIPRAMHYPWLSGAAPCTSGLIWRFLQCSWPCRAQLRLSLNPAPQGAAGEGMSSHGELQKRETSCYSTAHAEAQLWLSTSSEVLLICILRYLRLFDVSREVLVPGLPGAPTQPSRMAVPVLPSRPPVWLCALFHPHPCSSKLHQQQHGTQRTQYHFPTASKGSGIRWGLCPLRYREGCSCLSLCLCC